jgi:hypothetical protein
VYEIMVFNLYFHIGVSAEIREILIGVTCLLGIVMLCH